MPKGAYRLTAEAPGFVGGAYGQPRPIQVARSLDLVRTVEVADGERRGDVRISLWRQGAISGIVHDEAGEPMVGVTVTVLTRVTLGGGPVMQARGNTRTDDRGSYRLEVTPGDYVVAVLAAPATLPFAAIDAYLQAQTDGVEGRTAYQRSLTESGVSIPPPGGGGLRIGDLMLIQAAGRAGVPPGVVAQDGGVVMYPTTYHPAAPSALKASVVSVASGEEKTAVDLHLRPRTTVRVSGRVMGPEGPMAGVGLRLGVTDPAMARTSPATLLDQLQAMTNNAGEFTFVGVVPGDYSLRSWLRSTSADTQRGLTRKLLWAFQSISIGDSGLTDLVVTMRAGASISGEVVFEGGKAPPEQIDDFTITPTARPGTVAAFFGSLGGLSTTRSDTRIQFATSPLCSRSLRLHVQWRAVRLGREVRARRRRRHARPSRRAHRNLD